MKAINSYLIEKLKINKDTVSKDTKNNLKKGDYIGIFSFDELDNKISVYSPMKFFTYENNSLIYTNLFGQRVIKAEVFVNSEGYYEYNSNKFETIGLYLNVDDSIELINAIINGEDYSGFFDKHTDTSKLDKLKVIVNSNDLKKFQSAKYHQENDTLNK